MTIHSLRTIASLLAVGAALVLPVTASAQGAPATPAPAAAAPVVVSAEARAAIKELLAAMNTRENLTKTFQAMAQALPPQMSQVMNRQLDANAALTAEQKAKVREGMEQPFDGAVKEAIGIVTAPKLVDETIEKMYGIYAKYYTTAEVKQLVAFYKSPIGAKTLTVTPQAINESFQAAVATFQPRVNAIMDRTMKTQTDLVTKK